MRKSHVAGLIVTCGLVAIIVHQWPEIHRYMKMKRM
ncbi:DUF6893 family small protein [Nonomuraea muscovyensis]|jgi:hypothetical protein|uniref:Uncharacterized protein n=1 Tax=Nonomuraea muscovyensis TaxID=1124761 RepID=A0A7X0EYF4_9ACTN|nr:hypothetical protein [Nonomuraea muscovyensis]MDF2706099.1 hypothetical protein [Nonomuraea muscovyensis]